jgi:hypothetical protein
MASSKSPVSVLLKLMKRNYQKLSDARETFEVISNRMGVLDNPQELVAFLGQHLKPKELEKKQNGEVFTPPDLIQQKFNKLTLADPGIWSDPSKKFLDPANGIGNYPALAFHRLMEGLKDAIPNEADRKKHILENMIYMCELNKKNVEVSRKVFDPEGVYALNLYQGSYLDLDPKKEWGVEKFDVVFGNPPYQRYSTTGKANGGKSLWPTFVEKSMKLLKVNGFLVFVHPAIWRKPRHTLHDLMFGNQFKYLSIHTKQEGDKVFNATTRFDWYVLQKHPSGNPTYVRFDDGLSSSIVITPRTPYIANHGGDILAKVAMKDTMNRITALCNSECHIQREYVSKTQKAGYVFPCVNSTSKTKGVLCVWSKKAHSAQYLKKVVFSDNEVVLPFYDTGKVGLTQHGIYILVNSDREGILLTRFLNSKLVKYIVAATKWSNFGTFPEIFSEIPTPYNLPENFTDADVYTYFGLTPEEIGRIEADQRKGGLAEYVPLEAPEVSVPPPPAPVVAPAVTQSVAVATTTQTDYKKMKVADLKQLCKDRKIKGITGKNK